MILTAPPAPGLDPGGSDGFEATYLAANLRDQTTQDPAAPAAPTATVAARLRELNELLEQGLITDDEFAARRSAIIASL